MSDCVSDSMERLRNGTRDESAERLHGAKGVRHLFWPHNVYPDVLASTLILQSRGKDNPAFNCATRKENCCRVVLFMLLSFTKCTFPWTPRHRPSTAGAAHQNVALILSIAMLLWHKYSSNILIVGFRKPTKRASNTYTLATKLEFYD